MNKIIIFLLYLILNTVIIFAEPIEFGSDISESTFAQHNNRTVLIGNAYVKTDNQVIKSDRIEIYGNNYRFSDCIGNVEVHNSKDNFYITSNKLLFDNEKKEVIVTGNAVMRDLDNEMVIKGEYIKSFEETSITLIEIKVRIVNDDLICRSEFAEFNSELNRLVLTGDPVVNKGDDVFRASKIIVDLNTNDITLEGRVRGNISEDSESE